MNDIDTTIDDVDHTEMRPENVTVRPAQQMVLAAVERANRELPPDATPEVQAVVAELLNLMESLLASAQPITRMAMAEFALHRVIKAPNDLTLAKKVLGNLRRNLGGSFGLWVTRIRIATPPHVDVIIGLIASVATFGGIFLFTRFSFIEAISPQQGAVTDDIVRNLLSLGAVGAFGSVISILTRLNDFAKKQDTSAWLDVMNGFFKPVIGLAAADLFYILIKAGVVPISFTADSATYMFVGIAFLAGFSERIFKDLVSIVEKSAAATGERAAEFQGVGDSSSP